MTQKSTDLVTIDGTMTSAQVVRYFEDPSGFTFKFEEDPEEVSARIEAQLLGADSDTDIFGDREEVLKAREWVGRPLLFQSMELRPSDMEGEGLPFYGLFTVVTPQGEQRLLSCGARKVVLQGAKAAVEGRFPRWLKVSEVQVKNPVKGRSAPLELVAAPDPTEADAF